MNWVIGIAFWGGLIWFVVRGKESTHAIALNSIQAVAFAVFGIACFAIDKPWLGVASLAYSAWGVYRTIPWIRARRTSK